MRGKLLILGIFSVAAAFVIFVNDPLNSAVSFLIAGIVPGTNIVLGLWPTIGLAVVSLLIIRRALTHVRLKFLENTAKTITTEKLTAQFKDASTHEFDTKNRSVIAAPGKQVTH